MRRSIFRWRSEIASSCASPLDLSKWSAPRRSESHYLIIFLSSYLILFLSFYLIIFLSPYLIISPGSFQVKWNKEVRVLASYQEACIMGIMGGVFSNDLNITCWGQGGGSLGTNKSDYLISGQPLTTTLDLQMSWVLIFKHLSLGGGDQEWVECKRNQGNISHGRLPPLHILQQVVMWLSIKKKKDLLFFFTIHYDAWLAGNRNAVVC